MLVWQMPKCWFASGDVQQCVFGPDRFLLHSPPVLVTAHHGTVHQREGKSSQGFMTSSMIFSLRDYGCCFSVPSFSSVVCSCCCPHNCLSSDCLSLLLFGRFFLGFTLVPLANCLFGVLLHFLLSVRDFFFFIPLS